MLSHCAKAILVLLILPRSVIAWPRPDDVGSMKIGSLFGREDDFDPDDLSFIQRIAAIGDSYSAGIGAGEVLAGEGGRSFISYFTCRTNG